MKHCQWGENTQRGQKSREEQQSSHYCWLGARQRPGLSQGGFPAYTQTAYTQLTPPPSPFLL